MDKKVDNIFDEMELDIIERMGELKLKQEKVGYVFDEKMLIHKDFSNNHNEKPERAMAVYVNMILKGISEKLVRLQSEEITDEDVLRVHDKSYLTQVEDLRHEPDETKAPRDKFENSYQFSKDSYDNYFTYEAAKMSAGCLMSCCKNVVDNKVDHAFAIIRPPGHHASTNKGKGFCFFNNVAIAAEYLIKVHNKRVVVLDWDVHHGDGTQEIFYNKNNPLQISIHRHDNGKFYPYTTGKSSEIGENEGKGFNLNIPWNTFNFPKNENASISDDEYVYTFETIIIPVIKEFKPDIILVSCGFDAAENDPLGRMSVTPLGYAYMTSQLKKVCSKLIMALEGGYNVQSLARCSEAVIRTLINDSEGLKELLLNKEVGNLNLNAFNIHKDYFSPSNYAIDQVNQCKKEFESYWNCLKNVEVITPKRNFIRKDNKEIKERLNSLMIDSNHYLNLEIKNQENLGNNSIISSNPSLKLKFLKFKIGRFTIPNNSSQNNPHKFIRKTIHDTRTLSRQLNFRLEGISLNNNERHFNWVKRDGIFDTKPKDVTYLVSKFLSSENITKNHLIKSLEDFKNVYEKYFLANKLDLYNVDVLVLVQSSDSSSEGMMTRSKTKKVPVIKSEVFIKLNGLKEYSLTETDSIEEDKNNFHKGLVSLIKFLDQNILE